MTAAVAVLAGAGIALVAIGNRSGGASPPPGADPAASAHAAAGVATTPELAAAFTRRVQDLERRLEEDPSDRAALVELARLLHDGHRTREAVPLYRRALELDRGDATLHYDLAAAHGELGEWALARAVLAARVDDAPSDPVALYDLGVAEVNLGDSESAIAWWERARAAAAGNPEILTQVEQALARVRRAPDPQPPRMP